MGTLLLRSPYPDSAGASSLLTGLIGYWPLDEASGTRADASGNGLGMAPHNAPGNAAGKVGNAVALVRTSEQWLTVADAPALRPASLTLAAWLYLSTKGDYYAIFKSDGATINDYGIRFQNGADRLNFLCSRGNISANTFGSPPLTAWIFVVVWFDAGAGTINIQVNDGAVDSSTPGGSLSFSPGNLDIGAYAETVSTQWDGRIDEVGLWSRALTSGERTALYNGGSGTSYPFP